MSTVAPIPLSANDDHWPMVTLVDLADQFGNVPATRICLSPAPGQATEQHVLDLFEREHRLYELVEGTLIEKAMGNFESLIAGQIHGALFVYLQQHPIGFSVPADVQLRVYRSNIRIPDVAFISRELARQSGFPHAKIAALSPTIAVEVISESNSDKEMSTKLQEYFAGGSQEVWYVYPATRELVQYLALNSSRIWKEGTDLTTDLLPGFALNISEIFVDSLPEP